MGELVDPADPVFQTYVSYVRCGVRNGWMAVVEGAQTVVLGVAWTAVAESRSTTSIFFIGRFLRFLGNAGPLGPPRSPWEKATERRRLNVEVEGELRRGRPQPHRVELALDLVVDPGLDDVFGEDVALEQEGVVLLQLAQRLLQRPRHLGDVLQLLGRQAIDVLVQRL